MKINGFIIFCFIIMFMCMGKVKIDNGILINIIKNKEDAIIQLKNDSSVLEKKLQLQSQANLIMRGYIVGAKERELQKDSSYLDLINKIN